MHLSCQLLVLGAHHERHGAGGAVGGEGGGALTAGQEHEPDVSTHPGATYAGKLVGAAGEYAAGLLHAFVGLASHAASTPAIKPKTVFHFEVPLMVLGPLWPAHAICIYVTGVWSGHAYSHCVTLVVTWPEAK